MQENPIDSRSHYDQLLAGQYLWISGGFEPNLKKMRDFFGGQKIVPQSTRVAIDLGAGCGFQSVPLAEAGFRVTAVDLSQPLLLELHARAGTYPVETLAADILDFPAWSSRSPELIVCMGDTLTHLPDVNKVRALIRQCHVELVPGGKLILSLRDYSQEPDGSVVVIPVRRDADRIFLCRLEYQKDTVRVTDVLYSCSSGKWERTAGAYLKIRIAPDELARILAEAGFEIELFEAGDGVITVVAGKT